MADRFTWMLDGQTQGADPIADVIVERRSDAALLPTLGSIVPGWLLAVPLVPSLSLKRLDPSVRRSVLNLAAEASYRVSDFGSQMFFFEHGPAAHASSVGCGVDQAHLHVVPLSFDLIERVLSDKAVDWHASDPQDAWSAIPDDQEYYYISSLDKAYVGFPHEVRSQYFRRHIANAVGVPERWNYRDWPFYENVRRTTHHINGTSQFAGSARAA